jgi:uncharacterized protein (PEP-CTERM system associated)
MALHLKFKIWFFFTFIGLMLITYASIVHAAKWDFTPSIFGDATYSDNIGLDPDGEEEDDYIFQINPAFRAKHQGPRLESTFNYLMQNILSVKESDNNETFHQFYGDAKGEVLRETFFVDATTTFSQQIIDPEGRVSDNNINRVGNQSDAFTANVSPYWQQRLGNIAQAKIRYSYGIVDYLDKENLNNIDNSIQDSREHNVRLDLNDPLQRRLTWTLTYVWDQIDFEDDSTDEFQNIGLELDYQLTRIVGLIALGGYEKNEFERNVSTTPPEGEFWEVGVRLQPTPRDFVEGRYGKRFFGDIKSFEWTHTGRRITTQFRFSEELTTGNQVLLDTEFTPGQRINTDVARRRGEVFVGKRFDTIITYDLPKSILKINGFYARREFQTSAETDRNAGAELSWEWQFRPRTKFTIDLYHARNKFGGDNGDDRHNEDSWIDLGLAEQFGFRTEGYIRATYRRRDAEQPADEYQEKAISLGVIRTF